jgi:serine/threonine protein kinase
MIGTSLGHYRVVEKIGAGGMGDVYRAIDAKLGRNVALKILSGALAEAPECLARFEREARLLAALNHPNIATLHGFEKDGDTHFLVMELVSGSTLAERIATGAIPLPNAFPLFRQSRKLSRRTSVQVSG